MFNQGIFAPPGTDPAVVADVNTLKNNELKILYYASVSAASGTITIPTQATIILDDFPSGLDAVVETIVGGKPSGYSPVTAGGAPISVSSFDTSGNYTLSGTPSGFPVALLYVLKIKAIYYSNLTFGNIIEAQYVDPLTTNLPSAQIFVGNSNGIANAVSMSGAASMSNTGVVTINLAAGATIINTLPVANGGTGLSTTSNSAVLITDGSGVPSWQAQADAFNDSYGTGAGTICQGNDSRLLPNGIQDVLFTTTFIPQVLSPADATTYYFSAVAGIGVPGATDTAFDSSFPYDVTVVGCIITVGGNTTSGSGESSTLQLRNVTAGTSSSMGTFLTDGAATFIRSTTLSGLNINIPAGENFCLQIDAATFVTNPVAMAIRGCLIFKRTS